MKRRLPLILFFVTVLTTFGAYFAFFTSGAPTQENYVAAGLFSFCTMLILGSHEMGHYLMAKHHQVETSPPYFIPIPLGFGTMGAVIRLKGRIPNRNALVDIGAAGPLAGLLVAIPLLVVGIRLCTVGDAPEPPPLFPGQMSLLVVVPKIPALLRGDFELPMTQFFGHNLLTWYLQEALIGKLPPHTDLYVHPVYLSAWFGLVVTMLNLMPIGQLDGGHLTHAWFGERAIPLGKAMSALLLGMVVCFSLTWLLWFILTMKVVGYRHPEVILPDEPLTPGRKVVCAVCFVLFALTLMPMGVSF